MRNASKYPPDWRKRAPLDRAKLGNKCFDCGIVHGACRMAYSGDVKPVYLQRHHPDGDTWNQDARIQLLCPSCHFKRHYDKKHLPQWLIEAIKHRRLIAIAYCV